MPKADVVWETLSHGSRKTRLANKEKIEILNEKVEYFNVLMKKSTYIVQILKEKIKSMAIMII